MQLLKIPAMLVRGCFVINLILGLTFWIGNLNDKVQSLTPIHMLVGIVFVLSLFWLAGANMQQKGNPLFSILAFVDGVALYFVGVYQSGWVTGSAHWVIQALHLVLALLAIGLAEMISARLSGGSKTVATA